MVPSLNAAVIACLLTVTAAWLPSAWRNLRRRTVWVAYTAVAAAFTLREPALSTAIDRISGIDGLAVLTKHLVALVGVAAVFEFATQITRPATSQEPRPRTWRLATAAVMLLLVCLFALIPVRSSLDFSDHASGRLLPTAYLVVFTAYLGAAMGTASRILRRGLLHARQRPLRYGLALLATGSAISALYAASRISYLVLRLFLAEPAIGDALVLDVSAGLRSVSILLLVAGAATPSATVISDRVADYLALHRLRPLWSALASARPDVVLGRPPSRLSDLVRLDSLRIRLLRRTVEIRDAALLLRGHTDDRTRQLLAEHLTSAGLTGHDHQAALEAGWLTLALRAHRIGQTPAPNATYTPPGGCDLPTEVSWLCAVATAFTSTAIQQAADVVEQTQPARTA